MQRKQHTLAMLTYKIASVLGTFTQSTVARTLLLVIEESTEAQGRLISFDTNAG